MMLMITYNLLELETKHKLHAHIFFDFILL